MNAQRETLGIRRCSMLVRWRSFCQAYRRRRQDRLCPVCGAKKARRLPKKILFDRGHIYGQAVRQCAHCRSLYTDKRVLEPACFLNGSSSVSWLRYLPLWLHLSMIAAEEAACLVMGAFSTGRQAALYILLIPAAHLLLTLAVGAATRTMRQNRLRLLVKRSRHRLLRDRDYLICTLLGMCNDRDNPFRIDLIDRFLDNTVMDLQKRFSEEREPRWFYYTHHRYF